MLRKIIGSTLAVAFMAMGAQAMADNHDHGGMHGKKAFKIGTELRGEYTYDTMGLNKAEGADEDPTPQNTFHGAIKLLAHGSIGARTSYFLRYSLVDSLYGTSAIPYTAEHNHGAEAANVTFRASPHVSLRAGMNYMNIGGFERRKQQYDAMFNSVYINTSSEQGVRSPLGLSAPSFDLMFHVGHGSAVTVQLTNETIGRYATDRRQISALLEYKGSFGAINPILQYALTDLGKRHAFTVGLGYDTRDVDVTLDFTMDINPVQGNDDADADTLMNVVFDASMNAQQFTPFVKVAWFDKSEEGDTEYNSGATTFDDNKLEWAVGSYMRLDGDAFKPYLAIHGQHGNIQDPTDGTKTESRMGLDVKLGVMSQF